MSDKFISGWGHLLGTRGYNDTISASTKETFCASVERCAFRG